MPSKSKTEEFDAAEFIGCDHDALTTEAKAAALRATASVFDLQYHARFSGIEVAKILRAAAAEAIDGPGLVESIADAVEDAGTEPVEAAVRPCPECLTGKCVNCDGTGWDTEADAPAPCPCAAAGHGDDEAVGQ